MEHFLSRYEYYEGNNQELISYATELGENQELTQALRERYDDNLELLEEELEAQDRSYSQNPAEHERLEKLRLFS